MERKLESYLKIILGVRLELTLKVESATSEQFSMSEAGLRSQQSILVQKKC